MPLLAKCKILYHSQTETSINPILIILHNYVIIRYSQNQVFFLNIMSRTLSICLSANILICVLDGTPNLSTNINM